MKGAARENITSMATSRMISRRVERSSNVHEVRAHQRMIGRRAVIVKTWNRFIIGVEIFVLHPGHVFFHPFQYPIHASKKVNVRLHLVHWSMMITSEAIGVLILFKLL